MTSWRLGPLRWGVPLRCVSLREVQTSTSFSLQRVSAGKSELWGGVVTRLLTRCWAGAATALHAHHVKHLGMDPGDSAKRIANAMAALLTWDVSSGAQREFLVLITRHCLGMFLPGRPRHGARRPVGVWSRSRHFRFG